MRSLLPWLPQRSPLRTPWFEPPLAELIAGVPCGLPYCYPFIFPNMAAFEMREISQLMTDDFLAFYWMGEFTDPGDHLGYTTNFVHDVNGKRKDLYLRNAPFASVLGSAQLPLTTRKGVLIRKGESLACIVNSLEPGAVTRISTAVWGIQIPAGWPNNV